MKHCFLIWLGVQHGRGSVPPRTDEGEFGLRRRGGCEKDASALPQKVPHARHRRWPGENFSVYRTWENLPQDWLTLFGWERPEFFHLLPCNFNVQTHEVRDMCTKYKVDIGCSIYILLLYQCFQGYKTAEWASVWEKYRNCREKPKIVHKNGSFWNASWL